ncbi:hypothetical protein Acsp04_27060 [Actinomadura sp. NBRC 104425]|uniref:hypothetical protein n=1 Tax=Actinomadura sp. NBRC 104425 TaxID=3032204 RepID=UPI0024A0EAEF|nr:hypothetical protein [Actinomadura sp. NBRC 104425]GLZ12471.1 hypothetical protein Acsp04_27060 [Actinomadura sp. NBRC 104425]
MTEHADLGHEPEQTQDRRIAPVTRGGDARGRTDADRPGEVAGEGSTVPREQGMARQEDEVSGTGVPGVDVGQPDALPPDEEGVRDAERHDDSR